MTTIYRAEPRFAQQALVVLRAAGISAEIIDDPPPVVRQKSGLTLTVGVAVPAPQVARAREILQSWIADSERAAAPLSRSVGRSLLLVIAPPLAAWIVTSVMKIPWPDWAAYAVGGWVVGVIAVVAVVERRTSPDSD
ncbi:MAG TPA: hypothetical protein VFV19_07165 [Candidatus Polarisedimenticolaceae bacterium]|nr:hypothetical protein [Candidatus Polarisedimenticolaceae bacterium]